MNIWEEITYKAILKAQKDKEDNNIHPTHVNFLNVIEVIKKGVSVTLDKLVKDGKIEKVDTMNCDCYKIK